MFLNTLYEQPFLFLVFFFILSLWSMLWKGFGLWFSARNEQKGWFLAILIIDLAGLLPIIYLIWFKPKKEPESSEEKVFKIKTTSKRKNRKR